MVTETFMACVLVGVLALTAFGFGDLDQGHVRAADVTVIEKPKAFPVIDAHTHFRGAREGDREATLRVAYDLAVKTMELANIKTIVVLSGAMGESLDLHLKVAAEYPGKFVVFAGMGAGRGEQGAENLGEMLAQQVQDVHDKGAAGIGEIVKWALRGERGIAWDDPRLEVMWAKLEELQMPINWHVADPSRYWRPHSEYNTLEGQTYYKRNPLKFDLLMQQERVLEKHPNLVVVAAHSNYLADLIPLLESRFHKYPNYYCDLSATCGEWGRVPEEFKFLLSEHPDRFFFGTDASFGPDKVEEYGGGDMDEAARNIAAFYMAHYLFYGTDQRMIPVPWNGNYGATVSHWVNGWTRYVHDGVDLPDDVLERIYYRNVAKLLGLDVEDWKAAEDFGYDTEFKSPFEEEEAAAEGPAGEAPAADTE